MPGTAPDGPMTSHAPLPADAIDYCAAFDRCASCLAPIDFRNGTWVTLVGARTECPGRYLSPF